MNVHPIINYIKKQYGVECKIIAKGRYRFYLADSSFLDLYPSMYVRRSKISYRRYETPAGVSYINIRDRKLVQYVLRYRNMCKNEQEQLSYALYYIDKYKAKYAFKNNK